MMMTSYALGRFAVATVPDPEDTTSTVTVNNTCEVRRPAREVRPADGTIGSLLKQVAIATFVRSRAGGTP